MEDLDSIVDDIQVMYDEADARDIHWPILHIAFADIDFDNTPEFFYGYQTITGSHNKIWYRAYSLSERAMIEAEHPPPPYWSTYMRWDTDCAFFTGPENFIEGYYLNSEGEPCIVTNDSNTPNNVTYIDPDNQTPEEKDAPDLPQEAGGDTPPPEMTAEEAAALAGEADKALHDMDGEQLEPPPPFNIPCPDHMGEEHSPGPGHDENTEKTAPESPAAEEQPPAKKGRGDKPPKADKADKTLEQPDKDAPVVVNQPKKRGRPSKADKPAPAKEEAPAPPEPEKPPEPKEAPRRNGTEQIVYLNLAELHPFTNHPFGVRDDSEMKALVKSVKEGGVNQPALVRPREDGGYEIIAGHRRQKASELAGYFEMPCIVWEMTDDEAILAMTDDNLRQRSELLPSERAISLKMQVDAISHQGARGTSGQIGQK